MCKTHIKPRLTIGAFFKQRTPTTGVIGAIINYENTKNSTKITFFF